MIAGLRWLKNQNESLPNNWNVEMKGHSVFTEALF
jgi:hypothetical protein